MIRITQVSLRIPHTEDAVRKKVCRMLKIRSQDFRSFSVIRRSVDARKKPELYYTYTIEFSCTEEKRILKQNRSGRVTAADPVSYQFPEPGRTDLKERPVIIGSGPAGLFCAWMLAEHGYRPIVLERGEPVAERSRTVQRFWETGVLNPESNVQFGEGGAGTFSDGKLNTGVRDASGRNRLVLSIFHEAGAPESILYEAKPHLGTDQLSGIVETMRKRILETGGSIRFGSRMTDLVIRDHQVKAVILQDGSVLPAEVVVLAIGHSARDTLQMLYRRGISMRMKPMAVGVRVEHPQRMINLQQYGAEFPEQIGAADYKLTAHLSSGRSVYTFCMCPGGYVVNASSEPGLLAVNGMSYQDRGGSHANSAVVVSVTPEDYCALRGALLHPERSELQDAFFPADLSPDDSLPEALNGLLFTRVLERRAYLAGNGAVPVQRYGDFCEGMTLRDGNVRQRAGKPGPDLQFGESLWEPCIKGSWSPADLRTIFPTELAYNLAGGMRLLDQKLPGFAHPDTLLSGVESRTSSPVRIDRDERFCSSISGIYPCGEGAGYAGGITSAAMDGIKIAEAIAAFYKNFV